MSVTRRDFLRGSGVLLVGFSLAGCASPSSGPAAGVATPRAPATAVAREATEQAPAAQAEGAARATAAAAQQVDSWLAIGQDGSVTVYSGRVELGTGTQTALAQIVADELDVPFERVSMVMGDTALTPDEGYTAGSKTIQIGGVALRKASAEARRALLELASQQLGAPVEQLGVQAGVVSVRSDPSQQISYADLIGGRRFERSVSDATRPKEPSAYTVVGQQRQRVDLPGKLSGQPSYVHDVRLPGMLHGRVVRPPSVGAELRSVDEASVAEVPGLVKVVRNGSFLGVVAEREEQAIQAAAQLRAAWSGRPQLPTEGGMLAWLRAQPTQDKQLANDGDVDAALAGAARTLEATYTQPYQMHASIGPSCAVADASGEPVRVWSSTQGVYPLRGALAQLLGLPVEQVRVSHVEGAGCYGHNGFDDVAADAVLLSRAVGRPVRVQWSRQDEHAWEPKGPAMLMQVRGGLDAEGNIVGWDYAVWTPTHSTRPGGQAGNLLAGQLVDPPAPSPRNGLTGGDRNARSNYRLPVAQRVTAHWLSGSPLRPSALRSLGGAANAFANESFMDELAAAAGADPVAFRLRYLPDPRAQAVVQAAADAAGWQTRASPGGADGQGRGIAFIQYENTEAYVASVAEVDVDRATGQVRVRRVVVAHDCGLIINPDGLKNQIEGNVIQSLSRALKEQVRFDAARVTSLDWKGYPILTFPEVPDVEVVLINHPEQPAVGAGEPATLPTAAGVANAIFDAVGARVRDIPLRPDRVLTAMP